MFIQLFNKNREKSKTGKKTINKQSKLSFWYYSLDATFYIFADGFWNRSFSLYS